MDINRRDFLNLAKRTAEVSVLAPFIFPFSKVLASEFSEEEEAFQELFIKTKNLRYQSESLIDFYEKNKDKTGFNKEEELRDIRKVAGEYARALKEIESNPEAKFKYFGVTGPEDSMLVEFERNPLVAKKTVNQKDIEDKAKLLESFLDDVSKKGYSEAHTEWMRSFLCTYYEDLCPVF